MSENRDTSNYHFTLVTRDSLNIFIDVTDVWEKNENIFFRLAEDGDVIGLEKAKKNHIFEQVSEMEYKCKKYDFFDHEMLVDFFLPEDIITSKYPS